MTTEAPPMTEEAAPKKKRGRENALDMVRSLGLVLIVVIVVWWLAQPPDSDEQEIRVIDNTGAIASLVREAPGTPVPGALPEGWRATVADGDEDTLRLGWNTPSGEYAEYAASLSSAPDFLTGITGKGNEVGEFVIDGTTWRQFTNDDGATTLVRTVGSATVVVGGTRETTTLDELKVLAASVRP